MLHDVLSDLVWALGGLFLSSGLAAILLVYYLGRSKVKIIDKIIYGFEIPGDSIFYKLQRIPAYGAAFAWRWGAKRSRMMKIRGRFDKNFERPFILTFWLFIISIVSMISGYMISNFFTHNI